MSKTASEITDRALSLIDEVVTTFTTAATTETSIREQALSILPEVCRDLIKELPWDLKRYLAKSGTLVAETLANGEDQSDYTKQKVAFAAPTDFWELVSIKMTVWAIPVTEYIYINSKAYSRQNNPFTRSGKQNPTVALSNTVSDSTMRIECFSVNSGDAKTVQNFQYVSFDNVPDDEDVTWPDELFDITARTLAAELNIIKGRSNEAAVKGQEVANNLEQHQ